MARPSTKVKNPRTHQEADRKPSLTPVPVLPPEVQEKIRQQAEESSRKAMEKVRPQIEKAIRDALKKAAAGKP